MRLADAAQMRAKLASWSFPLGPLTTPEEVEADMQAYARALEPEAAPLIAAMIVELAGADDPNADALYEFAQVYLGEHDAALSGALLDALRADGPPELVELLGLASGGVVPALRATLDLDDPAEELVVALASALGDVGGPGAEAWLRELDARSDLGSPAREEIEIAFANLRRSR